jgi:hypothetical protein
VSSLSKQVNDERFSTGRNTNLNVFADPAPSPTSSKFIHAPGLSPEELANELNKEP